MICYFYNYSSQLLKTQFRDSWVRYHEKKGMGCETTRFPAGDLASFLGLRPVGSCLAPSPAGVSSFPFPSSQFCTKRTLQKEKKCS